MAIQNALNRILRTGTRILLGGDQQYDIYYGNASGEIQRLGPVANRLLGYDGAGALAQLTPAQIQSLLTLGDAAYLGTAGGSGDVAVLQAGGILDPAVIPAVARHRSVKVADSAARLLLTSADVQAGDEAFEQDTLRTYKLFPDGANDEPDPSIAANWVLLSDAQIDGSEIVSGVIAAARLGTGTLNSSAVLHGDGVFREVVSGKLAWTEVTGTTQAAAVNSGYAVNASTRSTITLPASATIGDVLEIAGVGSGGWRLGQQSGQSIVFGDLTTTTGTGGYVESTQQRDSISLRALSATVWQVIGSIGNIDVV